MHEVLESLKKIGIIPVIKIDDPDKAVPLAKALIAGGIPCAELVFRTPQAEEALRRISAQVPGILLGAGTVLSAAQVDKAAAAGARFIVSPGFNPRVVAYCAEKGLPIIPGCSNPSDLEQALEAGLEAVKFFPAEQSGGLEYIKAVAAPYSGLQFVPTGGINAGNIAKYIAYDRILACGGSWMVRDDLVKTGDFDRISALCKEAIRGMLDFSFVHLGVNAGNAGEALKAAGLFEAFFGLSPRIGSSSVFAGDQIEIMNAPGLGKMGHIGIGVTSVSRAAAYLERLGVAFNTDTVRVSPQGEWTFVYLKEEILGFAVHLVQKKPAV
jgi:2-dehydro-3-deoxyphosphogluconate aldolase/(4S)-4-hydroxy-2-oxoglutarate aldolase